MGSLAAGESNVTMISNAPSVSPRLTSLPVEAFEHYMLVDDRSDHPMCFFLRVTLVGEIEFKALQAAVRLALLRHPLLNMRLEGDINGKTSGLRWQLFEPFQMPFMSWSNEDEEMLYSEDSANSIDLHQEIGLRFFIRRTPTGATILMQCHHAVVDGMGAARFIEDMIAYYGLPESEPQTIDRAHVRPLDPELLALRGQFHQTRAQLRHRLFADILRIGSFFFNSPRPITPHKLQGPSVKRAGASRALDQVAPAALVHEFDAVELEQIRAGAKKRGATVNDLLLTELFLTLDSWQSQADSKAGHVPLRLGLPINMRKGFDLKTPACNIVSMCFLDRQPFEFLDHDALLRSVVRETRDIKDNYMGLALIRLVRFFGRWGKGLRLLFSSTKADKTLCTAMLTNLGQPLRGSLLPVDIAGRVYHGPLKLERLEIMPPLRANTSIGVGIVSYAGRLTLTMHYDVRRLELDDVQQILNDFVARIQSMKVDPSVDQSNFKKRLLSGARSASAPFWSLPIGKNVQPSQT